ncbi:Glycosyltransferase involved in cell wall bisynthesis [Glycomyces sambucus]|uniref:Glycosyltransferase involved in cell wall bisynthesis n=1 Tax=Glycomyces sambucus TaxID=380244 RepID=A0A1G9FTZ2_9ACTN|nr:glycosyltransferase [Glycomyces sambucus]SDK91827.1 Glycosyltransferase involved in cell wall bisynthesis [Glycomyces sambucus]
MLILAIALAAVGACCMAGAAFLQHGAVHRSTTGPVLRLSALRTILRAPDWYVGNGLAVLGSGLHIVALTLAPITVVQPIGMLALAITVVLTGTALTRGVVAALVLSVAGVVGLTVVSATGTSAVVTAPDVAAAQWALPPAAALAVAARFTKGRTRGLLLATAAAVLFGFTSSLVRAAAVAPIAAELVVVVVAEAAAAALAGAWLLHQAYAAGSAATAVGAATIVDPLVAVLIGGFAFGETASGTLAAMALPALVAVAGLVVLARVLPPRPEPAPARPRRGEGPLRIALTADTYWPDVNGAANFAHRLASGLAARGHEVHVVCPSTTAASVTETVDGVTVHRIAAMLTPFHPTFRFCPPWRAAKAVPALLTAIDPDLVHTQAHFIVGRAAVRAATAAGVPVVATNHFMPENLFGFGPWPRWSHRAIARLAWRDLCRVFGRATVCTTPTPRAAELLERNGLDRPVMAISCGIDRARYAGPRTPEGPPTLLFVGRLEAEKNVEDVLEAAAVLPAEVLVELVGDGSARPRLEARAAELGIADRVRFHGFVSDEELVGALGRCHVFCMPGTAELQSIATMEAMAAGRPVVAADAMALPHLVRPGRNGWLYPPGDTAAMAGHLAALLADEAVRAAMGQASLDLIASHDLESTLVEYERIYLDITTAPVPHPVALRAGAAPATALSTT